MPASEGRHEATSVARRGRELVDGSARLFFNVADFVDELRRLRQADMLSAEPDRLRNRFSGGDVADAYLAAVAVSLACELGVPPPGWAWDASRKLARPWFAHSGAALGATLLVALTLTWRASSFAPL